MANITNPPKMQISENFYFNREYSDFDELAENLRQWNIQIRQFQRDVNPSIIRQLSLGNILMSYGMFSGKTHQVGTTPPGKTIAFHTGKTSQIHWRNQEVSQNALMIFPSDSELDIVTKGVQNNPYTISFPDNVLASRFAASEMSYHELISKREIVFIPDYSIKRLQSVFNYFFQVIVEQPALLESKVFLNTIEERLLSEIIQALSLSADTSPREKKTKSQCWKQIEKVIEGAIESPIKVSELCMAVKVSERTLLRMFHDRFGISPKAYLCRTRLNGVRHNLKKSLPGEVSISDIANAWGFWHMGKFAADYKKLFGELPSQTYRANL